MNNPEWIGWLSSIVLLATIGRQVFTQWKTKATAGVSHWLFIGQLTASLGFTVYSYLLHNWVFLSSNVALLVTAVIGQVLYSRNRRAAGGARTERARSVSRARTDRQRDANPRAGK